MKTYLAQFTGTRLMTQEMIGTKFDIEQWVDKNRAKFKGETLRVWQVIGSNDRGYNIYGKMLGERVISA
jgi:uncharacterized membrane-anchored protein